MEEHLELVQVMMVQVYIKQPATWAAYYLDSQISCLHSVIVSNDRTATTMTALPVDQDASIILPASLFQRTTTEVVGIGFTFYETAAFFPLPEDSPFNRTVGSPVIGALVVPGRFNFSDLSENVTIFLRLTQTVRMPTLILLSIDNVELVSTSFM